MPTASQSGPIRRLRRYRGYPADLMAIRHRRLEGLAGFGHAVAGPAAGGLAEHLGELALGKWPAGLDTGAVGGHRGRVDVILAVLESARGGSWRGPGRSHLARSPVRMARFILVWFADPVRPLLVAHDRAFATVLGGSIAGPVSVGCQAIRGWHRQEPQRGGWVVRRPTAPVRRRLAGRGVGRCSSDNPQDQLERADQAHRWPGGHDRADWPVGPAVGHVRREGGDDPE